MANKDHITYYQVIKHTQVANAKSAS